MGHQKPLEEVNRRLRCELEIAREERDILKKQSSYFQRHRKPIPVHEGPSLGVFGGEDGEGSRRIQERLSWHQRADLLLLAP